jgi:RNA polymerase sigma-70 factor, ECF subfamily
MAIQAALYDENRKFLWNVCYRMTGNAADAEEIVQETFVRALETPPRDTTQPWRPWLTRVAVNLSRDVLRRRRKTEYVGPWLPSPIPSEELNVPQNLEPETSPEQSPVSRYDLQESITVAFLLALEALTPAQRAVLLLRDVFDYSTGETAQVLEMTQANVKITLHRARGVMRDYDKNRQRFALSRERRARDILNKFLHSLEMRDSEALEQLLSEDVVVVSDGAGEVTALRAPIHGREKVMRLLTQLYEVYRDVTDTSLCVLNHQPAVIVGRREMKPGHASRYTLQCEYDEGGRISRLNFVFAPSKLTAIETKEL